jgi:hypothetical protein
MKFTRSAAVASRRRIRPEWADGTDGGVLSFFRAEVGDGAVIAIA